LVYTAGRSQKFGEKKFEVEGFKLQRNLDAGDSIQAVR
jgi:hypothetical protein